MNTSETASTDVLKLQRQREEAEQRRTLENATVQQSKLVAQGKESATSYGTELLRKHAEVFSLGIDALLAKCIHAPETPGKHLAAWPLLLHFCDRGPRSIALIALRTVLDTISRPQEAKRLALVIGNALQSEKRGVAIHQNRGALLMDTIRARFGKRRITPEVMQKLNLDSGSWSAAERRELGLLLLSILETSTGLITVTKGVRPIVHASLEARTLIQSLPPRMAKPRVLLSLVQPEPWRDVKRGNRWLIGSARPIDRSHYSPKNLNLAFRVVNYLESQPVRIDPWMAQQQREAWDSNLPVVFGVQRDPICDVERFRQQHQRVRVELALRQAEAVDGRAVYLPHDMDFRGRIYGASRVLGHQGPDHQKALLTFTQAEPVDEEGLQQLFGAAAGHYGLGKDTWAARRAWGQENVPLMRAIVEAPLDRVDLWKGADDPWQFLQLARGVVQALDGERVGAPVRFDQTCSGMGIIACLCRDDALARLTNVIGGRRQDLYSAMGEALTRVLRMDLDSYDLAGRRHAELWLKRGITRSLMKRPVMTTVYGAKNFGLAAGFIAELMGEEPTEDIAFWNREFIAPARYLAKKLQVVIEAEMRSCLELEKWLKKVADRCTKKQKPIRWSGPAGFPVVLSMLAPENAPTRTVINGMARWRKIDEAYEPGLIGGRETKRGMTANFIHTFDAALCQLVILRCAQHGVPVLTNHDCFSTTPAKAAWLHRTLLSEMRQLYMPDWLAELRVEIGKNAGVALPHPPEVCDLLEARIGENPYCFS